MSVNPVLACEIRLLISVFGIILDRDKIVNFFCRAAPFSLIAIRFLQRMPPRCS